MEKVMVLAYKHTTPTSVTMKVMKIHQGCNIRGNSVLQQIIGNKRNVECWMRDRVTVDDEFPKELKKADWFNEIEISKETLEKLIDKLELEEFLFKMNSAQELEQLRKKNAQLVHQISILEKELYELKQGQSSE